MSPKRRLFSSDETIAALVRAGFREGNRIGSSHRCFLREAKGRKYRIAVPLGRKEISRDTFDDIPKEADLTYEDFLRYAKIKKK